MISKSQLIFNTIRALLICLISSSSSSAAPLCPALQSAKQAISTGKADRALTQIDAYLKNEPDSADAHYYHGLALLKLRKKDKAKQAFETASLLSSDSKLSAECKKQIELLSKGTAEQDAVAGRQGKDKVFRLHGEQNRTLYCVSPSLRKELRAQVADLYQLAAGSNPLEEEIASSIPTPSVPKPDKPKASKLLGVTDALVIPEVKLNAIEKQALTKTDVYFIVDHSQSMCLQDCPGRLSRWGWVQAQMNQMEGETKQCMPRGVTMVFFDHNAEEFRQVSSTEMLNLFTRFQPRGSTNTGLAFSSQINNVSRSLSANHPVLIIAMTDGLPSNKLALSQAISDLDYAASRQKASLRIAFLQIGSDSNGLDTLTTLREMLTAHKTMVKVHSFEDVCKKGLTRTMLDEL